MKVLAKDLKVGMTIRLGYWVVEIESIKESLLKNGKVFFIVSGKTRSNKNKFNSNHVFNSDNNIKENTIVTVL